MFIIAILLIAEAIMVSILVKGLFNALYFKYRYKLLKILVKLRYSYYDYGFMTNLTIGIFASSIVALIVSTGTFTILVYTLVAVVSFIAMIDYNYKNKV